MKEKKDTKNIKQYFLIGLKSVVWFGIGVTLGLFFSVSFIYIIFQRIYGNKIYPGVYINNINVGGQTESDVLKYFVKQNQNIGKITFTFVYNQTAPASFEVARTSAKELQLGYNAPLLAHQAYDIGRSKYLLSNIWTIFNAYLNGVFLSPSYFYNENTLMNVIQQISQKATIEPTDALFTFQNNRVTAFRLSSDGQEVDTDKITQTVSAKIPSLVIFHKMQNIIIPVSIKILKPKVSSEAVNNLGIKELIGTGESLFQHSIAGRIYNVTLAATRLNGILIAPGEIFSFDKALGDVSAYTGYQQAYVIQNGKTVLGDGGGVCQVSTTFFRAALNAGLPIFERHAHDYRVGYYEEDGPPGIDATVYVPSIDLKIKNDTEHWILIQTVIDPAILRLTFNFYGMNDGRQVTMTEPVVTNQTPPPPPLYTDDSTLPKGIEKQVDFAAWGAHVSFSRTVTKNNKVLLSDIFVSDYRPWQAAFVRGTKE